MIGRVRVVPELVAGERIDRPHVVGHGKVQHAIDQQWAGFDFRTLYAIVFLIFDVEAVFLLPFAAAFSGLSLAACLAMLVFLLLLVEGLVWACQKGVLTWA